MPAGSTFATFAGELSATLVPRGLSASSNRSPKLYALNVARDACLFPCLGIFPGNVIGVIKVQQQSFSAIEKTQAEDVVVKER